MKPTTAIRLSTASLLKRTAGHHIDELIIVQCHARGVGLGIRWRGLLVPGDARHG